MSSKTYYKFEYDFELKYKSFIAYKNSIVLNGRIIKRIRTNRNKFKKIQLKKLQIK